jgi:HrpA-like RNA helicase
LLRGVPDSLGFNDQQVATVPIGKLTFRLLQHRERDVKNVKLAFSEDSRSDHIMLVKAFQQWEMAKEQGYRADQAFCRENFLSGNTLSMLAYAHDQSNSFILLSYHIVFIFPSFLAISCDS